MWERLKLGIFRRLRLRESWVIFFTLGIIMMNYPFVNVFNKHLTVMDIPLFYLYLTVGWFVSIFVIYLFTRATELPDDEDSRKDDR